MVDMVALHFSANAPFVNKFFCLVNEPVYVD